MGEHVARLQDMLKYERTKVRVTHARETLWNISHYCPKSFTRCAVCQTFPPASVPVCSCGVISRRQSWGIESSTATEWSSGCHSWLTDTERRDPVRPPLWLCIFKGTYQATYSYQPTWEKQISHTCISFSCPAIEVLNFPPGGRGKRVQPIRSLRSTAQWVGC